MKVERTIIKVEKVEVEVSFVVVYRTSAIAGMGSFTPAGKWKVYAVRDTGRKAKRSLTKAKKEFGVWYDYEIREMTEEEIKNIKRG